MAEKKKIRGGLKLFVWTRFCRDYTDGLAVAIAHNEKEARKMIIEDRGNDPYYWGNLIIHPLDRTVAYSVCGGG